MRLSTYDKPRIIACAEDHAHHIGLPRGCLDDVRQVLDDLKIRAIIRDERYGGQSLDVTFQGELRPGQKLAADATVRMICAPSCSSSALRKRGRINRARNMSRHFW